MPDNVASVGPLLDATDRRTGAIMARDSPSLSETASRNIRKTLRNHYNLNPVSRIRHLLALSRRGTCRSGRFF
jgi:hypothetical protein